MGVVHLLQLMKINYWDDIDTLLCCTVLWILSFICHYSIIWVVSLPSNLPSIPSPLSVPTETLVTTKLLFLYKRKSLLWFNDVYPSIKILQRSCILNKVKQESTWGSGTPECPTQDSTHSVEFLKMDSQAIIYGAGTVRSKFSGFQNWR